MFENASTIPTDRLALGYHAVIEAIALTGALQREMAREGGTGDDICTVGPTLLRRIDDLQQVLLDLLDANEMPLDEMRKTIHGVRAACG